MQKLLKTDGSDIPLRYGIPSFSLTPKRKFLAVCGLQELQELQTVREIKFRCTRATSFKG